MFIQNIVIYTLSYVVLYAVFSFFTHSFFGDFETDIKNDMEKLKNRMDSFEPRFESKITSLEEKMFYLSTGKTLQQAQSEKNMKKERK